MRATMFFVCSLSHSAKKTVLIKIVPIKIFFKECIFFLFEFREVQVLVHMNIKLRKDFDPIYAFPASAIYDIYNSNKKILSAIFVNKLFRYCSEYYKNNLC